MAEIKVTVTDTQMKCLEYIALSVQDWCDNAVHVRSQVAQEEIIAKLVTHCNEKGIEIATGVDAQITQAYTLKVVDTAKHGADNLGSIAKARGTTVAAILKANPGIKDKNKIRAGAGLKGIPGIQGSSTIKNIADAGPKGKSFPVGTKFGELYKGKGKKKASGKVRAGRGTTGDRGNQTETATKKKSTPGLKGRKQRREKRNFNIGGMASVSSMDDYMKDLL